MRKLHSATDQEIADLMLDQNKQCPHCTLPRELIICRVTSVLTLERSHTHVRELRHGDLDDERQHQTTPPHFLKCYVVTT